MLCIYCESFGHADAQWGGLSSLSSCLVLPIGSNLQDALDGIFNSLTGYFVLCLNIPLPIVKNSKQDDSHIENHFSC